MGKNHDKDTFNSFKDHPRKMHAMDLFCMEFDYSVYKAKNAVSLERKNIMTGIPYPRQNAEGVSLLGNCKSYTMVTSTWLDLLKDGNFGKPLGYLDPGGKYEYN